jgi:hypothetical protein
LFNYYESSRLKAAVFFDFGSHLKRGAKTSLDQLHRLTLLVGRDFDVPLARSQLTVPSQFHDRLDAHGVIGECGDEHPPS